MKKIVLICCFFMSCLPTDKDWKQDFYNNTDCDIYMLINQHQENGVIYPYYGELPLSIDHVDCNLQSSSWAPGRIYYILPYGTKINRGDCIHVYAFHADTLKKYTWEEIRTGKKYWFRETVCQSTDIQLPDGFKYMEESDAENP